MQLDRAVCELYLKQQRATSDWPTMRSPLTLHVGDPPLQTGGDAMRQGCDLSPCPTNFVEMEPPQHVLQKPCPHTGADEDAWEVVGGALAVRRPALLATERELLVLADGGASLLATLPLAGVAGNPCLSPPLSYSDARQGSGDESVSRVFWPGWACKQQPRLGEAPGAGWACRTAMRACQTYVPAHMEHACQPACPEALTCPAGLQLVERYGERSLLARSAAGRCAGLQPGPGAGPGAAPGLCLSARLDDAGWLLLLPALRVACSRAQARG